MKEGDHLEQISRDHREMARGRSQGIDQGRVAGK